MYILMVYQLVIAKVNKLFILPDIHHTVRPVYAWVLPLATLQGKQMINMLATMSAIGRLAVWTHAYTHVFYKQLHSCTCVMCHIP